MKSSTQFMGMRIGSLYCWINSEHTKKALLAAEDAEFYQHKGLDYFGIMKLFQNLKVKSCARREYFYTTVKKQHVILEKRHMKELFLERLRRH